MADLDRPGKRVEVPGAGLTVFTHYMRKGAMVNGCENKRMNTFLKTFIELSNWSEIIC